MAAYVRAVLHNSLQRLLFSLDAVISLPAIVNSGASRGILCPRSLRGAEYLLGIPAVPLGGPRLTIRLRRPDRIVMNF